MDDPLQDLDKAEVLKGVNGLSWNPNCRLRPASEDGSSQDMHNNPRIGVTENMRADISLI